MGWDALSEVASAASRVRDAEVVILERSGHVPWLDEPESFFPAGARRPRLARRPPSDMTGNG
jgi:pimeloyl-ACP methyl ester carboxylesterase